MGGIEMTYSIGLRIALIVGGLVAIALSFALQSNFATDPVVELVGPGVISIVAIAGVVSIAVAVLRGKN
jgi:asparagine N-glycosylation enzyme membrane subunit Stt3